MLVSPPTSASPPLCESPRPSTPPSDAVGAQHGAGKGNLRGREEGGAGVAGAAGWEPLIHSHPSTGGLPSALAPRPSHVCSPLEFNFGCARGLSSYSQKKNSPRAGRAEDRARVTCPLRAGLKMTREFGKSLCTGPDLHFPSEGSWSLA